MPEIKARRKVFRLVGLLFPATYAAGDRIAQGLGLPVTVAILVLFLAVMVPLELARFRRPGVNRWLFERFRRYTKEKERARISSTTWFLGACLITVLSFDKGIATAAMLMLVTGDPVAEIVGTRWGRIPVAGKSLEGTLAGFAACVCVTAPLAWSGIGVTLPILLIGACGATLFELIPSPIDDNFVIPIGAAVFMAGAAWAWPVAVVAASPVPSARVVDGDAPRRESVERLLDEGRTAEAAAVIDAELDARPDDALWQSLLVRALRDERRYEEARRAIDRLLASSPASLPWHLLAASIDLRSGRVAEARRRLEDRLRVGGDDAILLARLAEIALLEGRRADARDLAQRALAGDPAAQAARIVLIRIERSSRVLRSHLAALAQGASLASLTGWIEVLEAHPDALLDDFDLPATSTAIPLRRLEDGRVVAQAMFDGIQAPTVLIDTAAAGLIVSDALARHAGWSLPAATVAADLAGLEVAAHPWIVEAMRIGPLPGRQVRALVAPLPDGLDAIVNPFVLGTGAPVAIVLDLASPALLFEPIEALGEPSCGASGGVTHSLLAPGAHRVIAIGAGDRIAHALIDTGASVDLMDRSLVPAFPEIGIGAAESLLESWAGPLGPVQPASGVIWRIDPIDIAADPLFLADLHGSRHREAVDVDVVLGAASLASLRLRFVPTAGCVEALAAPQGRSGAVGVSGDEPARPRHVVKDGSRSTIAASSRATRS